MNDALQNDCTDKRLIEWSNRCWAHEIVFSTTQMKDLVGVSCDFLESMAGYGVPPEMMDVLARSEFLHVEFETMNGASTRMAFLATEADFVAIGDDCDGVFELLGWMTHDAFWEYLGSFPNIFKHLQPGCERSRSANRLLS